MSQHLVSQLERVNDGDLTKEDREAITQMIEINKLLKKEADHLVAFSQKSTSQNATAFNDVRLEVWPKIAKLLGIKTDADDPAAEEKPAPK